MKINRKQLKQKYGGRCAYCGAELGKRWHADHIDPKYRGGPDDIENLNPSCPRCNSWKMVWTIEEFRREIELQTERLKRYSSSYRLAMDYGLIRETKAEVRFYFERVGGGMGVGLP